ncbi:MAG: hypothetical protein IJI10_11600 [Eubacterium sp.]|nr:hypothetical protein [Eubacterium sp.]
MSECMLCQSRRAEQPFLIEPVGLRIWSIEELLYFIGENLPLVDEDIINQKLVDWIKEELHMRRLAGILTQIIGKPFTVREFVLPIFHETGYPGETPMRKTLNAMDDFSALPTPVRLKKKADVLVHHTRYLRAIETYHSVLDYQQSSHLGAQFTGVIYHNIGCVYAKLFQMEEACSSLKESYRLLHSSEALKHYLTAVYLKDGREAFLQEAKAQNIDPATQSGIEKSIGEIDVGMHPENPDEALAGWVHAYHRSTGL